MISSCFPVTTVETIAGLDDGSIAIGPFGSSMKASLYTATGVPVVRGNNIGSGRKLVGDYVYVAQETADRLKRSLLKEGDLFFPHRGAIGEVGIVTPSDPQPLLMSTSLMRLRVNTAIADPDFVFWFFKSAMGKDEILQFASTVGTPGIGQPLTSLRAMTMPLPPLTEQREIASILGALDDKIELNRRMAATLEEMARALYRSWFVDFDPVKAKADGQMPAFMDEETAALFPDRFGDDGLPEGWARQAIGLHFRALKGLSYKGSGLCDENAGLPLHNLNSVLEGGGYKYSGIKYYRGDYKDRHVVHPGDLIVANTEQGFDHMLIGHSAIVPRNFGPMGLFSHHLYKVEPKASTWLSREWLYLTLSAGPSGTVIRSFSNGTTVNMLPSDAFDLPLIVVPPQPVIAVFNRLTSPWFERRDEAIAQTATLGTLRDTLLPKLMSGELRVAEARDQIEEVA